MKTYCLILLMAFILHVTNCENRLIRRKRELITNFNDGRCENALKPENFVGFMEENVISKTEIRFVLKTLSRENKIEDTYIPITTPDKLLSDAKYKTDKPLVIFISGFTTNLPKARSPSHDGLANAFVKHRPEVNFVTIDTSKYLAESLQDYYISAIHTRLIGSYLAVALGVLIKSQPKIVDNLHLIGHSLGAQICGQIGRELKKVNILVPRITGLDPAGPCFNKLLNALSKDDANFVDVIHTDPGTLGSSKRNGHVDFYPNGGVLVENAPACAHSSLSYKSYIPKMDDVCSHTLSWAYFAESVVPGYENDFLPERFVSDNGSKIDPKNYPMGYAANSSYPNGQYVLKANKKCPFGGQPYSTKVCEIFEGIKLI